MPKVPIIEHFIIAEFNKGQSMAYIKEAANRWRLVMLYVRICAYAISEPIQKNIFHPEKLNFIWNILRGGYKQSEYGCHPALTDYTVWIASLPQRKMRCWMLTEPAKIRTRLRS